MTDFYAVQVAGLVRSKAAVAVQPRVRDLVAEGIVRYVLTICGEPGMTRAALMDATGLKHSQVRRVTRRMAGEVHAIGEGFGGERTVRYSLVRAANRLR